MLGCGVIDCGVTGPGDCRGEAMEPLGDNIPPENILITKFK